MRPLDDVLIVSIEHAIAAPFATRQLADMGARVIKIERPGGGDFARDYDRKVNGMASHFVWVNRSKESITLDIKSEEGNRILETLLSRADVFIQNLAPGAADRLGLSYGRLGTLNPRLIVVDISGYGKNGPYSAKKAYDLLIQCESGLVSLTGTEDEKVKVPISIADIATGMYAMTSILGAIRLRDRTGVGCSIEISMLEALGEWMGYPTYFTKYGGTAPVRMGATHASIAPYGPVRTGDGEDVFFGIQNEAEWRGFCRQVLDMPELAEDSRFTRNSDRVANRQAMNEIMSRMFAAMTAEQLLARLEAAGIANARLNGMDNFIDHPQLRARDRWREVQTPVGPIDMLLPPFNASSYSPRMDPVPELGQDTVRVLTELGLMPGEIEELRSKRSI